MQNWEILLSTNVVVGFTTTFAQDCSVSCSGGRGFSVLFIVNLSLEFSYILAFIYLAN
jgi:hypothetical protein